MNIREHLPLWRQIELAIKEEIVIGELRPGDELAPTASLAVNYGVNIHTVRKALKELHDAGVVSVQNGRRAIVRDSRLDFPISSTTRFTENVTRQGRTPATVLVRSAQLPAPSRARTFLGLNTGEQVILMCTRGEADGVAVSYGRNYLPLSLVGPALALQPKPSSTLEMLASAGIHGLSRIATAITCRMPTEEEATHLRQPRNEPVMVSEYVEQDDQGRRVRYAQTAFSSSRVQLVVGESALFD